MGRFDYESAREDLRDMGLDPDELPEKNIQRRDTFLRKAGIDPDRYKLYRDRNGRDGSGSDPRRR